MTNLTNTTDLIGTYVSYKGNIHMVVEVNGGLAKILDPRKGNGKLNVSIKNLGATNYKPATVVTHMFAKYIVTGKGVIISCTTGRVMMWHEKDGNRVAILALASA